MGVETVALALAVASAATAASSAYEQNRAVKKSGGIARQQAADRISQIQDAASIERRKEQNRAEQIRGRLRVSAAASGLGLGGSFAALDQQAVIDQALNVDIINRNAAAASTNTSNDLNASLTSLQSHIINPVLAGFTGGVQGFGTGLKVGRAVNATPSTGVEPFATDTSLDTLRIADAP